MNNLNASNVINKLNRSFLIRKWYHMYRNRVGILVAINIPLFMILTWAWGTDLYSVPRPSGLEFAVICARSFGTAALVNIPALFAWIIMTEEKHFMKQTFTDTKMLKLIGLLPDAVTAGLYEKLLSKKTLSNQDITQFLLVAKNQAIDATGFAAGDWHAKQFSALVQARQSETL